jgi:hypothetical protein
MPRISPLLVLCALVECQRAQPNDIERRLHAITSAEMARVPSEQQRLTQIRAAYDELARVAFARFNDRDIAVLLDGAYHGAFYGHDVASVGLAATLLDVMEKRGIATDEHYLTMHETFMGARMFDEARALAARHPVPGIEAVPELRSAELVSQAPTELVVDPGARVLLRRSVDLQPAQVLVVSHPLCHFSQDAMRDIEADPVLREAFIKAKWLGPQHNNLKFDAFQRWNHDHPGMQHTIAYRKDEWQMIDWWGTPTFYFIKDGAVIAKAIGWPKEGRRAELLADLRHVGLLREPGHRRNIPHSLPLRDPRRREARCHPRPMQSEQEIKRIVLTAIEEELEWYGLHTGNSHPSRDREPS